MIKSSVLTIILLLITSYGFAQKKGADIKFDNTEHDYGSIKAEAGKVDHVFYFTNTGDDTLIIERVQPACGCTASDWTKTPILPGERGSITASFDPLGRRDNFRKSILVVSNSYRSPNKSIFIKGNIIPREKDYRDTFRIHLGNLLFKRHSVNFVNLDPDEKRTDTLRFYNNADHIMTLDVQDPPEHIETVISANELKPGQRGFLVISFDAGKLSASRNRTDRIFLKSNDPRQELKVIFVSATILEEKGKLPLHQRFPFHTGTLSFSSNNLSFGEMLNTESQIDSIHIYNNGRIGFQLDVKKPEKHIKASLSEHVILPGETVTLIVEYDASKADGFGFRGVEILTLQTTDSIQPLKPIFLSANIKEDFSGLSNRQRRIAPVMTVEEPVYDFGTAKVGQKIRHSFIFSNTGRRDLIIRNVISSCGCAATKPEKKVVKSGESSKIDIVFNTHGKTGQQSKTINVVTNDPENSEIVLEVKGIIER